MCTHACNSKILFLPGLDREFFQTSVVPAPGSDPAGSPFTIQLRNSNGIIYSASLPAGSLRRVATGWVFKDTNAAIVGGIQQVRLQWGRANGDSQVLRVFVKSHGDPVGATEPEMTLSLSIASQIFEVTKTWRPLPRGGWIVGNLS